ncbi:MAG: transglycosylase SLT domain-containing protein [Paracoccaceae bacterium]
MEGAGKWFDTEDAARAYVFRHFKAGARSFDVGCFQINYKWHHQAFQSLDDMFDPRQNAHYAARFLTELFGEYGSWDEAVGAYHSKTDDLAARYLKRFKRIHANIPETAPQRPFMAARTPMFQTASSQRAIGGAANFGSLMPASSVPSSPLISLR